MRRAMLLSVGQYSEPGRDQMSTPQKTVPRLVDEHEVAEILRISVATVRRWRLLKRGPMFIKVGAAVRYRLEDISTWVESRPTGGEKGLIR
jgi:predicted DNA-binding transcriptional regulator AlpA